MHNNVTDGSLVYVNYFDRQVYMNEKAKYLELKQLEKGPELKNDHNDTGSEVRVQSEGSWVVNPILKWFVEN